MSATINTQHQQTLFNLCGWLVALATSVVYVLTLEPSVSFWDCGEFIATSHTLQVGHPPGAPLYQLLAHCFMLFAGNNPERIAWCSNLLSAVAGGLTAMFLFWTLARVFLFFKQKNQKSLFAAFIGTACYVFCDTAWFSAVESEVYSLSMLFSSIILWCMVRWVQCDSLTYSRRWLLLISLLLGLSVCVHQLSLLTIPAILVLFFCHAKEKRGQQVTTSKKSSIQTIILLFFFFIIGLTPYLIIPIRAAANPPINSGNPSTIESFKAYFTREQYEHAPLLYGRCYNSPVTDYKDGKAVYAKEMDMFFPRMWKRSSNADIYYNDWCGRHGRNVYVPATGKEYYKPSFGDNIVIFVGYQIGYMYLRYLMWNFSGRYNDQQGFGNLQKGQFITGINPIDKLYVGTSKKMPPSMPAAGHNRYFLLPFLLGLAGLVYSYRHDKRCAWTLLVLFLTTSILLSIYLNHPIYEPRERDYAYILSFYTFAIWIGIGVFSLINFKSKKLNLLFILLVTSVPVMMAAQNWDDHNRSNRYIARDSAVNLLNSCDNNALLFTAGDNDTYPLWYLQHVEGQRNDVQVINISLLGSGEYYSSVLAQMRHQPNSNAYEHIDPSVAAGPYRRMMQIIGASSERPIFFSHYAANDRRLNYDNRIKLCGMAYMLTDSIVADSVDIIRCHQLMTEKLKWHNIEHSYIDETSASFLNQYWNDAILAATNLATQGFYKEARAVLDSTRASIPLFTMHNPFLTFKVAETYRLCCDDKESDALLQRCRNDLEEQLEYYNSMSPKMQKYIPYTIQPLKQLQQKLQTSSTKI